MTPAERRQRSEDRIALAAVVLAAIALVVALAVAFGALGNASELDDQRAGRRVAIEVTCGAISAVIDAGRAAITGSTGLPPEFARFLERHGYPPAAQREAQAQEAARRYAASIATEVQRASKRKGLVDPETGRLDCAALVTVAHG